jgi:hypothetical protein
MVLPTQPVQLEVSQLDELNRHLSSFRHDVNGSLSLMVAAMELIRYSPDAARRMAATINEQPPRIAGKTHEFILECERVIGVRPATEASWYRDLWSRYNAAGGELAGAVSLTPEAAKRLHSDLLHLGKELMLLGFIVSGANVLAVSDPRAGADVTQTAGEQLMKMTAKFNQLAASLEKTLQLIVKPPTRLPSGAPSGPVTLSVDQLAFFHGRLMNLERDMTEQLLPLLDLSKLARLDATQVAARAPEFAQQSPKLQAIMADFSVEFDKVFQIKRAPGGGA